MSAFFAKETFVKRIIALAVACLMLAGGQTAQAQNVKPLVVISISSYAKLKDSILYLAKTLDTANQAQIAQAEGMADAMTGGLDTQKPIGATVAFDGAEPIVVGFLPVKNLNQFLGGLALFGVQAKDAGNGLKSISNGLAFVKEQDGYAYVAQKAEYLQNLPDPAKAIGTLGKQFDLGIVGNMQNLPLDLKQQALSLIRMGLDQSLEQQDGESDAQFNFRKQAAAQQMKQLEQFFNETEQITIGWQTDKTAKKTYLDMIVTAARGTRMAKSFAALKDTTTKFGGVVKPDAPFSMHVATEMKDQEEIDQAVAQIKLLKTTALEAIDDSEDFDTDEERDMWKGWASQALDVLQRTVEGGRVDFAASFQSVAGGPATVLAGMHVADGKALEKVVVDMLKTAEKKKEGFPKVTYNAGTHKGTAYHTLALDPPEDKEVFEKIFGEKAMLHIGYSTDTVWIAMGANALDQLKAAIDGTGERKAVRPMAMTVALGSIMKLAAEVNKDDPQLLPLANAVAGGSDHIRILVDPIDNGEKVRFEIEEGVFKLIGVATKTVKSVFDKIEDELK
jgi:hypothetical protein